MSRGLDTATVPGYFEGGADLESEAIRRGSAPHLGHAKHLCYMADRGADLEAVKKLVKRPKFICKKCGRAAAKEVNLCEPVPL